MTDERRPQTWHDAREKAERLDANASLDTRFPEVQHLAERFGAAHPDPLDRARAMHRYVRDTIGYRRDPGGIEEFADSGHVLHVREDDCDGKARLFVALCRAAGLLARIRPVATPARGFYHVQAEVDPFRTGRWMLAELILRGVELGQGASDAPRDAAGRRWLAGPGSRPVGK